MAITIDTGIPADPEEDVEKGEPAEPAPDPVGAVLTAAGAVLKAGWEVIKPREDERPAESED